MDQVQGALKMLFDRQYILTEDVVTERRYYIETGTWTDEDGNTRSESDRVYYDYYICTVTLENFKPFLLGAGETFLQRYLAGAGSGGAGCTHRPLCAGRTRCPLTAGSPCGPCAPAGPCGPCRPVGPVTAQ